MENYMAVKPATLIETTDNCAFGCGNTARYVTVQGKLICDIVANKCPSVRAKNSAGTKQAYLSGTRKSGAEQYQSLTNESKANMAWAKGLTKETHDSILSWSIKQTGKRKITDELLLKKIEYKDNCMFQLSDCIKRVRGYTLLREHGMYHKKVNPSGVVRDHRVSVHYGFINGIDSKIISHPANCEFILHSNNAKKTWKNSCSIEELMQDIQEWEKGTSGERADAVS